MIKPWNRAQRAMAAKPTRKAVQAALAAQAPPDWQPKPREKKRRGKVADDGLDDLAGERDDDAS